MNAPRARTAQDGPQAGAVRKGRRSQEERKSSSRARFIEAAIQIIGERGYAGLKLSELTKAAGLTWGAAQNIFGEKNGLLVEVAMQVTDRLMRELQLGDRSAQSLEDQIRDAVGVTWAAYSGADYLAMVEIVRGSRSDPELHAAVTKAQLELTRQLEGLWVQRFAPAGVEVGKILATFEMVTFSLAGLAARRLFLTPGARMNYLVHFVADLAVLALTTDVPAPRGLPAERVRQASRAIAARGSTAGPPA